MKYWFFFISSVLFLVMLPSCGGRQQEPVNLDIRPLEETKAFKIIEEILAERGYLYQKDVDLGLRTGTHFKCDYKIRDRSIAIEYLTDQDRQTMGDIPPAAKGSRLHVLSARLLSGENLSESEQVFVLFIDERNFLYHFNPTPERRADVTILEVDSRLRRDLQDFLSWYETTLEQR